MAELKVYRELEDYEGYGDVPVEMYGKDEADSVIAELEERVRQERSAKVNHKISANDLNEGLAEAYRENRKLKRALYKALANWALSTLAWLDCIDQGNPAKWYEMQRKCLDKAKEYR